MCSRDTIKSLVICSEICYLLLLEGSISSYSMNADSPQSREIGKLRGYKFHCQ